MSFQAVADSTESKVRCSKTLIDTIIILAKGGFSQASPDEEFNKEIAQLNLSNVATYFISPIQFNFINIDQLKTLMRTSSRWGGIVLSSTRCVDALVQCLSDLPDRTDLLEQWSKLKIFTVGEATRQYLKVKLQLESRGHQSGNATSLAQFILDSHAVERIDKPLIYPCSSIRSDSISDLLRNKLSVKEVVCYETIANQRIEQEVALFQDYLNNVLQSLNIDSNQGAKISLIVVFFSPSGVENLLPNLQSSLSGLSNRVAVKFVAFGKVTAAKMTSCGLDVWFVASAPKAKSLAIDLSANLKNLTSIN